MIKHYTIPILGRDFIEKMEGLLKALVSLVAACDTLER